MHYLSLLHSTDGPVPRAQPNSGIQRLLLGGEVTYGSPQFVFWVIFHCFYRSEGLPLVYEPIQVCEHAGVGSKVNGRRLVLTAGTTREASESQKGPWALHIAPLRLLPTRVSKSLRTADSSVFRPTQRGVRVLPCKSLPVNVISMGNIVLTIQAQLSPVAKPAVLCLSAVLASTSTVVGSHREQR